MNETAFRLAEDIYIYFLFESDWEVAPSVLPRDEDCMFISIGGQSFSNTPLNGHDYLVLSDGAWSAY